MSNASCLNGDKRSCSSSLPKKITVKAVMRARYENGGKPANWDDRAAGVDVVTTVEGDTVNLLSNGGQSTPKSGWVLMLLSGNSSTGYEWTLYGYTKGATV